MGGNIQFDELSQRIIGGAIEPIHEAQILTYLKLAKVRTGLLINFNVPLLKDGLKRFVL